jgi:hypothetical protein
MVVVDAANGMQIKVFLPSAELHVDSNCQTQESSA